MDICTMCVCPAAGLRQYLLPGSQPPQIPSPGHRNPGGPEPLCSCWQSPIAHRNTHAQTWYIQRDHQWLTGAPLAPLVASSLHGFPFRNTSTADPQTISPASLAQYLLKLTYSLMHLCFLTCLYFFSCLHHQHLGP